MGVNKGSEPRFSVCLIARNEAAMLPRLMTSLTEFRERGGDIVLVDTGSADDTVRVARDAGCRVVEVGSRFVDEVGPGQARAVNEGFVVGGELPVVTAGDTFFRYDAARNFCATLARHDMVSMPDCDEIYAALDIDAINERIANGAEQLEFNFIFAHDSQGRPSIRFVQCKMYDRRKLKWTGVIHEVLTGAARRELLPESVLLLEHFQNESTNRAHYLRGLALECHRHPDNDRNSHYLGRELVWTGRPKSAIRELTRHVAMDAWPAERAQSMIYIGDAHGQIGEPAAQLEWYNRAFNLDPTRRESLIRLAEFHKHANVPHACAAYAGAALEIPRHDFYANHLAHYQDVPHALAYWAKGWMGDIPAARHHLLEASKWQPRHPEYLRDARYYMSLRDEMTEKIRRGIPFTFVKRGDGELACMNGESGATCDGQAYSAGLADALRDAYGKLAGAHIVEWADQPSYNCLLHRVDNDPSDLWKAVRDSARRKIFVGPARLRGVAGWLGAEFVEAPQVNAFDSLADIKSRVATDAGTIMMASMGPAAKPLLADIHAATSDVTLIDCGSAFDPLFVGATRTCQLDMSAARALYPGTQWSIPRRIFTIWLNESPEMPELVTRCIASQRATGYEHRLITLADARGISPYVDKCLDARHWVKASDWLRFYFVWRDGGIFLDADMEVLEGRNFDDLLDGRAFFGKEFRGWWANSGFGAVAGHPLLRQYLDTVSASFDGADEKVFEAGMQTLSDILYRADLASNGVREVGTDAFYPFDHQTGATVITPDTLVIHHYARSWMPLVSICIPTLGRPDKLARLVDAIPATAGWPRFEIIVEHDSFTERQGAPLTLKRAVERSTGDYVAFLGNDCVPQPGWLGEAMRAMRQHWSDGVGLVGLNDGYWHGEFATHWVASRKLLPMLDGEFFHTGYHHCGCDNELTERCRKLGRYVWCESARVDHDHPVQRGFQQADMDEVYELAYNKARTVVDIELLTRRSREIGFDLHGGFEKPRVKPAAHPSYELTRRLPPWHKLIDMKVANVGIGSGQSGIASQLPFVPFRQLDHIEVYEPYIERARTQIWDAKRTSFIHADIRDVDLSTYDLVLMFDVLEHLPKADALRVLESCRRAVVFIPLESSPRCHREGADDIPSQDHLSTWDEIDFVSRGFRVERLVGFHREAGDVWDALWAFKGDI